MRRSNERETAEEANLPPPGDIIRLYDAAF